MYLLDNELRPYQWGSKTGIAGLLGREPSGGPEAELWIGAHPGAPSRVVLPGGGTESLAELIARDPVSTLGSVVRETFGDRLPFLLKVLAAGAPLSLQVHPTPEQARSGFAAEEAAGVPLDSPTRNYKDDNHKPELIYALSPFEALCGFRPAAEAREIFVLLRDAFGAAGLPVPELLDAVLTDLASGPDQPGQSEPGQSASGQSASGQSAPGAAAERQDPALRAAFTRLLTAGDAATAAVNAVVALLGSGVTTGGFARELATVSALGAAYPGDPGVLISLLLNRASLAPGEVLYLPAGNIHAYLSGLGVEVMASSDNVLRGGLTPKHVDVDELLKTVDFRALPLPLLASTRTAMDQEIFSPPFREFQLQRVQLAPGAAPVPLAQHGPLLLIAVAGAALVDTPRSDHSVQRGQSIFVPDHESPALLHPLAGATDDAVVFAVTVSAGAFEDPGLS